MSDFSGYPWGVPPGGQSGPPFGAAPVILDLGELSPGDQIVILNAGALVAVTTLAALAAFGQSGLVGLTATNPAADLPGATCLYTTVPAGTGANIPESAAIGSLWDVWNAGANDMTINPFAGALIGGNATATVVSGGRATFMVASETEIVAR